MTMTQKPYRCLLLAQLICGRDARFDEIECRAQAPCPFAHILNSLECSRIRELLGLGLEELLDLFVSTEVQKASHADS